MKAFCFVILCSVLTACGSLTVSQFAPNPNVDIDSAHKNVKLDLTADVKDTYEVPSKNGMRSVAVSDWRKSLTTGFENSFGNRASGRDVKTLQISRAEIELAPAAMSAQYGPIAAYANLTYQARLVDAKGNVLKRSAGTVTAKSAFTSTNETTTAAQSAVESMYEKIATDLFQ